MVCLSLRSPHAASMLRKAARIADRLGAPWYALYVKTPQESMDKIDAATERELGKNLDLARQLGGTVLEGKGKDLVSTIDVSPRSTVSRTSCSAAAASPGTAACSSNRLSIACSRPSMESI